MIKPTWAYTHVALSRYPVQTIYITLVKRIIWRCTNSPAKSCSIQQIPVCSSDYSVFISHPSYIRTDITKYHRIWSNLTHGVFKTMPVIHLFFSIGPFAVCTVPP